MRPSGPNTAPNMHTSLPASTPTIALCLHWYSDILTAAANNGCCCQRAPESTNAVIEPLKHAKQHLIDLETTDLNVSTKRIVSTRLRGEEGEEERESPRIGIKYLHKLIALRAD